MIPGVKQEASPSSSHGGSCWEGSFASPHAIAKKQQVHHRRRPIIRVVHVFAPTLIETDTANFRALVQRLTGNKGLALEAEIEAQLQQSGCFTARHPNNEVRYLPGVDSHEEISIFESSRQGNKKSKRRKPSFSDCLLPEDSHDRKKGQSKDPALQDGLHLLMSRNCSRGEEELQHGEEDNDWVYRRFSDSMESGRNLQNCLEFEKTVEDVIDGFLACGDDDTEFSNMSFESHLGSSNSSYNTFVESPSSPLQGKVEAIDEKLTAFHHSNAPHHMSMQFDNYSLLLNSSW